MRTLLALVVFVPLLASAQGSMEKQPEPPPVTQPQKPEVPQPEKPEVPPGEQPSVTGQPVAPQPDQPGPQPMHAAVPVPKNWNIGAGISFPLGGFGFSSASLVGLAGLGGTLGGLSVAAPQPRVTILIERRLSEHLFLGFQATVTYGANQSETFSALSFRHVSVEGTAGIRRVFNPGGLIEVSGFGNAGFGYASSENRQLIPVLDAMGMSVPTPSKTIGSAFSVGAVAGLTFERELISGLALRFSSSVVGVSYGRNSYTTTIQETETSVAGNGIDAGLRFSPTIELRYAF